MSTPASGAVVSACERYRYRLWRRWADGRNGVVVFVMLNPSTADATVDDPTIRKCVSFAKRWDRDGIEVVNLFALRSTDPRGLLASDDPAGPDNNEHIAALLSRARPKAGAPDLTVCAWGAPGSRALRWLIEQRWRALMAHELRGRELFSLGTSKDGSPRHPLMLAYTTPLQPFREP